MNILGVIPARFESSRFPGKPLALIQGIPMIEHVYNRCLESEVFSKIIVATDDDRIRVVVESFGGEVTLTDPAHLSGTDRCFEALSLQQDAFDAIINIQGDEPFIHPKSIVKVANLLKNGADIATLAVPIQELKTLTDKNKVKVVISKEAKAIYFSRAAIPFQRDLPFEKWLETASYFIHLGIYGFGVQAIEQIKGLEPTTLEQLECLEQLRWLENGYSIEVGVVENAPLGIDTPEDLVYLSGLISKGLINF